MSHISDAMAEMYRTQKHIKPMRTNKFTRSRVKQYEAIKEATGQDPQSELDYAMQIINENIPQIQRYVLSQNETPASSVSDLVIQAYRLRCQQIGDISTSMDIPQDEAEIWLEMDESEDATLETSSSDSYLGSVFAAIGIAASRLEQSKKNKGLAYDPDYSNLDPSQAGSIVGGITQVLGGILSGSELKRAASNKPSGVVGSLSTGGSSHYDALRAYFQKNPSVAQQVLNGTITSEAQLPNWSGGGLPTGANMLNSNDITSSVAQYQKQQMIAKYLPIILIGVVVVVLIIVLATRKK